MNTIEWQKEHSFPWVDVNVPDDLELAEFVMSEGFSRSRFSREARELGIPLEGYILDKFEDWKHAKST